MTPLTPYTVVRTRRRTVQITVELTGEVIVRAPARLSGRAIAAFVAEKADWIVRAQAAQQARAAHMHVLTPAETAALRQAAHETLPALTARWAQRMGVSPTGVRITSAARRWGSCSAKNGLCFSLRVMLLPEPLREYIVVHELSHIRQKNHSPAFYAEAARYLPDFVERKRQLRDWERTHPLA